MNLESDVRSVPWYHTLDLGDGVVTPGEYDLRPVLASVPLPASLAGMRCLDVGTHDGFWAFEMERRGAAEVVAIDLEDPDALDWPLPAPVITDEARAHIANRRRAFSIAHAALGSRVDRRDVSVYRLDPASIGRFDFAVIGTLLLHLRDPVGALMAIRRVLDGQLFVNEVISVSLTTMRPRTPAAKLLAVRNAPFWWVPNVAALRSYVRAAGFDIVDAGRPYLVPNGAGRDVQPLPERSGSSWARMRMMKRGHPHAWVLARPAPDA